MLKEKYYLKLNAILLKKGQRNLKELLVILLIKETRIVLLIILIKSGYHQIIKAF